MKHLSLFFSLLFISLGLQAQTICDGNRYFGDVFTDVTVTQDVYFGKNVRYNGDSIDLYMDVYEPMGDTETNRPLIVLAHGGTFISGDKVNPSMVALGNAFAKKGYVVSSIQYRLGVDIFALDSVEMIRAVVRSVQDAKAAVRYFKKNYAENNNSFGVDTSRIFIGGSSAGGVMALHYVFLDDTTELPPFVNQILNEMGGPEGETGNPGYSSDVFGCINLCGAVGRLDWVSPVEEPVVSVHGDMDDVVPYGTEMLVVFGLVPIMVVSGSGTLHPVLEQKGIPNALYTFTGDGHVPYEGNPAKMAITVNFVRDFLYEQLCPGIVSVDEGLQTEIKVYPNPAAEVFYVDHASSRDHISLIDLQGREVISRDLMPGNNRIGTDGISPGVYLARIRSGEVLTHHKIIIQ